MAKCSEVVLDSSMLLGIAELKVDVFSEIGALLGRTEFSVTGQVLEEMKMLAGKSGRTGENAGIALRLLEKNRAKVIAVEAGNADESLVEAARQGKIVATNDAELRKKIKSLGGRIIYLRKKKIVKMG